MFSLFSHVQLFGILWTVAHQATLSMGFSRQQYWSGLPMPSSRGIFLMKGNHVCLYLLHRRWILSPLDTWKAQLPGKPQNSLDEFNTKQEKTEERIRTFKDRSTQIMEFWGTGKKENTGKKRKRKSWEIHRTPPSIPTCVQWKSHNKRREKKRQID